MASFLILTGTFLILALVFLLNILTICIAFEFGLNLGHKLDERRSGGQSWLPLQASVPFGLAMILFWQPGLGMIASALAACSAGMLASMIDSRQRR